MMIKRAKLDDNNELIIRSGKEFFSDRFHRRRYCNSIREIIIDTGEQKICVGICLSNTYTGADEFVQYTPQCIIFFKGNSIIKRYRIERVFDIATMQSVVMNKEDIKGKYDIDLPEEVGNPLVQKRHLRNKGLAKRRLANCVVAH